MGLLERIQAKITWLTPEVSESVVLVAEAVGGELPEGYELCAASEAAAVLAEVPEAEREDALRQARVADLIHYAVRDGKVAFWEFMQLDRTGALGDILPAPAVGERRVCGFGAFCMPEFRGRGLMTEGRRWVIAWAAAEGYTVIYSKVRTTNAASLRAQERAGFRRIGISRTTRWRGKTRAQRVRLDRAKG
jgi:RimJ/RimL family protein N-acetyltransferase